jgi:hypothetical protein
MMQTVRVFKSQSFPWRVLFLSGADLYIVCMRKNNLEKEILWDEI